MVDSSRQRLRPAIARAALGAWRSRRFTSRTPARRNFPKPSSIHALKRAEARAPSCRAAAAGARIRRDSGHCSMASRARLLPETLSQDSVPRNGWRVSSAPRHE